MIIPPGKTIPYFVNGLGGRQPSPWTVPAGVPGSLWKYNTDGGAQRITYNSSMMVLEFWSVTGGSGGTLQHSYVVKAQPRPRLMMAAIGDFGTNQPIEVAVAAMIKRWNPLHILTMGYVQSYVLPLVSSAF